LEEELLELFAAVGFLTLAVRHIDPALMEESEPGRAFQCDEQRNSGASTAVG
jgi:hypothetical protein